MIGDGKTDAMFAKALGCTFIGIGLDSVYPIPVMFIPSSREELITMMTEGTPPPKIAPSVALGPAAAPEPSSGS